MTFGTVARCSDAGAYSVFRFARGGVVDMVTQTPADEDAVRLIGSGGTALRRPQGDN